MGEKKTKAGFVELFDLLYKYADEEKIWGFSVKQNEIVITTDIKLCEENSKD